MKMAYLGNTLSLQYIFFGASKRCNATSSPSCQVLGDSAALEGMLEEARSRMDQCGSSGAAGHSGSGFVAGKKWRLLSHISEAKQRDIESSCDLDTLIVDSVVPSFWVWQYKV